MSCTTLEDSVNHPPSSQPVATNRARCFPVGLQDSDGKWRAGDAGDPPIFVGGGADWVGGGAPVSPATGPQQGDDYQ